MLNSSSSAPAAMRCNAGQSGLYDTSAAAMDIVRQIAQPGIGLILVFADAHHDLKQLCQHLERSFENIPVIGCSTAGQFGPTGYTTGNIVAVSIHEDDLTFELGLLESISTTTPVTAHEFASRLNRRLRNRSTNILSDEYFALMLIDGAHAREEIITHAFQDGLGGTRLIGGTAGTPPTPAAAQFFFHGKIFTDAAILLVGRTAFPFEVFKIQHFKTTGDPWVVTAADPNRRVVTELNGLPAAEEYARALNTTLATLDPSVCIHHPMLTRIGNEVFVRSINSINTDGSLDFYCGIEPGTVLRLANAQDMIGSLTAACENIQLHIGQPALTLGFDCILHGREIDQHGQHAEISSILQAMNAVGFSSLGEQFCGMHVNQTLTGISFGRRDAR